MAPKKKRFTLDLELEMQQRLKIAAALMGISMRQYCIDAIESRLALEDTVGRVQRDSETVPPSHD